MINHFLKKFEANGGRTTRGTKDGKGLGSFATAGKRTTKKSLGNLEKARKQKGNNAGSNTPGH